MSRPYTNKNTFQVRLSQEMIDEIEQQQGEDNGERLLNWIEKKQKPTKQNKTKQELITEIEHQFTTIQKNLTQLHIKQLEEEQQQYEKIKTQRIQELAQEYYLLTKKFTNDILTQKITITQANNLLPQLYHRIIEDAKLLQQTPNEFLNNLGYAKKIEEIENQITETIKKQQKIQKSNSNIDDIQTTQEEIEE